MGNAQSNSIGEKIILKILNDLKNQNSKLYDNFTNEDKIEYTKKELKKYNLFIEKKSNEYKNLQELIILNKELNNIMDKIFQNYDSMRDANKLFRMAFNLDNIIDNFTKYSETINSIKDKQRNLKEFINNFFKHQKSYKFEKNKNKSSEITRDLTQKAKKSQKGKKTQKDKKGKKSQLS